MFVSLSLTYLMAMLFFVVSIIYIYILVVVFKRFIKSNAQKNYNITVGCLALFAISFGFMTIAENEAVFRTFWSLGFLLSCLFFSCWLIFLTRMVQLKYKISRLAIKITPVLSVLIVGLFVICGDVVRVVTRHGNQFNYTNNIFLWIVFAYVTILFVVVFVLHLKWWLGSELKRNRVHARNVFIVVSLVSPVAFTFEYVIPIFTNITVPPIGSILVLIPTLAVFSSLRGNQTFSITVPNVSKYIFQHSTIPTLILDQKNNIRLVNKAFYAFFKYDESIIGSNIAQIITRNDKVPEQELFDKSLRNERVSVESELGATTCELMISVERDKYGDPLCKVVLLNDVTENEYKDRLLNVVHQVSSILLEHKASLNDFEVDLLEAMGMIAHAVQVDRMYIWKNYLVEGRIFTTQIYEWSEGAEAQQGNQYTVNVSYDDDVPTWEAIFTQNKCINGLVKDMNSFEQAALAPQGIISILIVPVFLHDEFWGIIGFDDCTKERIFTENEEIILRSVSKILANALVRNEMTNDLREASGKLESAVVQANAASKAKSEFLSNMSHEMRTPLNAIFGMTALGKRAGDMGEKDFALSKIEEASSHLLGVISDVLDMAKIEANKLELFPVEYNFEDIIGRAVSIVSFRREEKNQKLTFNIDENLPRFVIGDDQRFVQVLTNLLSNAVKFTPEDGTIHLEATLIDEKDDTCKIGIEVKDSGIGISAQQAKKLFTAFEQASSGTTREFGGTGLGLVISKRIVALMGGQISIESEEGLGTKVAFTVDVKRSTKNLHSTLDRNIDRNNEPKDVVAGEFTDKNILLVEDIEINREILIALLAGSGLVFDCAENGQEAVMKVRENPDKYDIVFMDIQMPLMDGLEATRCIRKLENPGTEELPIIAMTANVFREDIEECEKAGMNAHLGKPLDIEKVLQVLREYLV